MKRFLILHLIAVSLFAVSASYAAVMSYNNYTTPAGDPMIVPEVSSYRRSGGSLKLPALFTVTVPKGEELIIEQFAADLKKFPEITVSAADDGFCRFILTDRDVPKDPEGYLVEINKSGITVRARTAHGLFYGAQTLRCIFRNAAAAEIACCRISDEPTFAVRAYVFDLRRLPPKRLPMVKKCIEALAALKINTLLIGMGETFPYTNNPFTKRKNAHSREDISDLLEMCRKRHIKVIPYLQVMSHMAWMTSHPEWDKMKEGVPDKHWNSTVCPQNEEGRKIVAMAINEQIDLFKPEYFNIVYDELFLCPFRQCPKCRRTDAKKLLSDYLKFATGLLAKRGVKPMVCQDSFISKDHRWPLGDWFRTQLPADTTVRWWCYEDNLPERWLKPFSGFTLQGNAVCGKPLNTYNMAHLIKKYNGQGCSMVYWYYSSSGVFANLEQETPDSLGGIVNGAGYYWRLTKQPYPTISYDGTLEMMRIMYPEKITLPPRSGRAVPVPLLQSVNAELSSSGKFPRFDSAEAAEKLKNALAALPERFRLLTGPDGRYYALRVSGNKLGRKGILFSMQRRKFDMMSLLLTASRPQNGMDYFSGTNVYGPKRFKYAPAAVITVKYTDGTKVNIPLRYRRDITDWNRPFGGFNMRWAVRGLDADKKYYTFGISDLKNPHPEKAVSAIGFSTKQLDNISPALLAVSVWGLNKPFHNPNNIRLDDDLITKRRGVPADPVPEFDTAYDFENGRLGDLAVSAPDDVKKAMKLEVTEDPSSPTRSKVLKITIPPGKYKGRKSDLNYLRISVDLPFRITPATWSVSAEYRLKCHPEDLHHANQYLMDNVRAVPGRRFISIRMPVAADNTWHTIINPVRKTRLNGSLKDVNTVKFRRLSFFFRKIDHPVELYFDNIGSTAENISAAPVWKEGTEAEPY